MMKRIDDEGEWWGGKTVDSSVTYTSMLSLPEFMKHFSEQLGPSLLTILFDLT